MSQSGERRSALLLASLSGADRRQLLAALPKQRAARIKALIHELGQMPPEARRLAQELLQHEAPGTMAGRSLGMEQLKSLSGQLSVEWLARVLQAWPGIDQSFVIELLPAHLQAELKREMKVRPALPAKLSAALRHAAMDLTARGANA
ncbi:hypothetical protein [Solilutibacter silvestris]|uniref:hypothetical protein n=1 Tax=Solilutibacter silvestris TaxID=1645665 RepID=UPI003D32941B